MLVMRKQCHICLFVFYFRVMVLEAGKIVEVDHPNSLLKDRKSIFYAMAKDAGLVQQQHNADHYIIVGRGGGVSHQLMTDHYILVGGGVSHQAEHYILVGGRGVSHQADHYIFVWGRGMLHQADHYILVGERCITLGRPLHSCGGEVCHIRQTITFLWGERCITLAHGRPLHSSVGRGCHICSWQTITFQWGERLSHQLMTHHYILVGGGVSHQLMADHYILMGGGVSNQLMADHYIVVWGERCFTLAYGRPLHSSVGGEVFHISSWQTITFLCEGRGVSHQLMADHYIIVGGERCFTLAHGRPLHSCVGRRGVSHQLMADHVIILGGPLKDHQIRTLQASFVTSPVTTVNCEYWQLYSIVVDTSMLQEHTFNNARIVK